jgi:arginase
MRNIRFIENRSELGAGTRGASLGVDALKMAAVVKGSRIFQEIPKTIVEDMNEALLSRPIRYPFAKKIDAMVEMYHRIAIAVKDSLLQKEFPFVLSGDHSNAGGTIAGIRMAFPDKKLGVIWIDAHADIHSPYTTPSGNLHGMPLAASLNIFNLEDQVNDPDAETRKSWENLCKVGDIWPKIFPEDVVLIDIRDLEPAEWQIIRRKNIRYYEPHEVKQKGIPAIAQDALDYLSSCDLIYVSFDVDSMDPTVSTGTGTPVANGLPAPDALDLLSRLWIHPRTIALEITEINPLLDSRNRMAATAFEFINNLIHTAAPGF